MPLYETVFIARQDLSPAQVDELIKQYSKVITDAKGKVTKTEDWGLRTLAYRIEKSRKGFYALIESDTPSEAVIEMERQMRFDDNILRFMTIKLEELSDGPSVMMDGSDKDREAA